MTATVPATPPSGIDLTYVDESIRPQDDLFRHVNGKWLAEHVIPADRAVDGSFYTLRDRAEENVRDIIESVAAPDADPAQSGPAAALIAALYRSFIDTDTIAARGLAPVQPWLDAIDAVTTASELAALLGRLQRAGYGGPLGYYIDTDSKQSDRYLAHVSQSGLSLPDESYYKDDKYADVREKYRAHVGNIFALAGLADQGDAVLRVEHALAQHHWDVVARRDADKTYNLRTFAELRDLAGAFDIGAWTDAVTAAAGAQAFAETVVGQPSFVTGLGEVFAALSLDDWKSWARWKVLHGAAPYLPEDFVAENFAFYGATLSGTEEIRERWRRGVSFVEGAAGFAVGELYVAKHFPPEAKAQIDILIANLVEAYRRNISTLEWMGPDTRQKALAKLDKFTPKVGYPASWRDYSGLVADPADLIGNSERASVFEHDREFHKLGTPVDRDEWFMTPQTVNAYYNPGLNEIVFPAAILQPPFFDPAADPAVNYGGIGAVIGHEIGHGFDDQGAKYDGDGNLNDWWTDTDRQEFGSRTGKLIAQYDAFSPAQLDDNYTVNGGFTIGENIGDLGGLSIALAAYAIATADAEPPVLDGLTGVQRVFYNWAQIWRSKSRDEEAILRLAADPHSPPEFRCNGVLGNIASFYDAFDVTESDQLFLDPDERVRIW